MGDIITNAIPVYKGEGTLSPWNQPNPLHAKTHLSLGCRICHWQRIESGTPSNDDPSLADLYPSMPWGGPDLCIHWGVLKQNTRIRHRGFE